MKKNETANQWEIAIRFFFISFLVFGFMYPLAVTGLAQSFFSKKANGSLVMIDGNIVGSELLAQKINSKSLFRYRPSAIEFNKFPSGASNLAPSSLELKTLVNNRKLELERLGINPKLCKELLYTSGSGLDPHISVGCAYEQAQFLHRELNIPIETLNELIGQNTEFPLLGMIGRERVNVTKLNLTWKQMNHE